MNSIKLKITDSALAKVSPEISRITDTEIKGFHVRLGKTKVDGSRHSSYYFYYKLGGRAGKDSNYKIGATTAFSAKKARAEAKRLSGMVAQGQDPQAEKRAEKIKIVNAKADPTVNDLLDEFVSIYIMPKRKRPEEAIRVFNKDVRPHIGKYKLKDINRRLVIAKVLDPIAKRGNVQANKTLGLLKQTFKFAVERGLMETNPIEKTTKKTIGGDESPRERYLTMEEIRTLLTSLPQTDISLQVQVVLQTLLLSGCRVGEITLAEWSHIDFEKRMWTFPPENTKSKKDNTKSHYLPLNGSLIRLLTTMKELNQSLASRFVFPCLTGTQKGKQPMDKRSVARAINRHCSQLGIEKFTPHDLRRTVQTQLAAMGVNATVIEKILNHQLQGMLKVYNKYDYMKERDEALTNWAEKIEMLNQDNICFLKA